MRKFAKIISYLFHPLLMATYGCILVFFGLTNSIYSIFTPLRVKIIITLTVFAFTFLLPVLNLLVLYRFKFISSLTLDDRRERIFPLITTALCYFGLYYMLYDFNIWPAIKIFILGAGVCILIAALIHLRWQISAHMIGIGGLVGVMIALSCFMQLQLFMALSGCLLLAGFIGFSRLFLNAHTQSQVYAGFVCGLGLQLFMFYLAQTFTLV